MTTRQYESILSHISKASALKIVSKTRCKHLGCTQCVFLNSGKCIFDTLLEVLQEAHRRKPSEYHP